MITIFPEYISFIDWAAALIADNPTSYLPLPPRDESNWQEWGAIVAGTGVFRRNRVPSPFSIYKGRRKEEFKDWQEWAKKLYLILSTAAPEEFTNV